MKKSTVAILVLVAVIIGLVAGGVGMKFLGAPAKPADGGAASGDGEGGNASGGAAIANVYVNGETVDNDYDDKNYLEYELTLFTDGTYQMRMTEATSGYGMVLSHTAVTTFGTYEKGESSDGYTACELSEATRIMYNGFSDMGGYNLSHDTDSCTFPVELPGGIMTEKEDFWAQYGAARTVYIDDASTSKMVFSLD